MFNINLSSLPAGVELLILCVSLVLIGIFVGVKLFSWFKTQFVTQEQLDPLKEFLETQTKINERTLEALKEHSEALASLSSEFKATVDFIKIFTAHDISK